MTKIEIEDGWSLDCLPPHYYNNPKRQHNWIAKVSGFDDEGNEIREYLNESHDSDSYFFFGNKINKGDVIAVGCYDRYKPKNSERVYYKVFNISPENMELSDAQTTYRKAKRLEIDNIKSKSDERDKE